MNVVLCRIEISAEEVNIYENDANNLSDSKRRLIPTREIWFQMSNSLKIMLQSKYLSFVGRFQRGQFLIPLASTETSITPAVDRA
jgi:hypothetical protein